MDMRPCIQIEMMRRQKTHPTAALANRKKCLTIPKQVRSIISKMKSNKNKNTITLDQETNRNPTKQTSNQ